MKMARSATGQLCGTPLHRPATASIRRIRHFSESGPLRSTSHKPSSSSSSLAGSEGDESPVLAGSGKREGTTPSACRAEYGGKKNLVGLTKDELKTELLEALAI